MRTLTLLSALAFALVSSGLAQAQNVSEPNMGTLPYNGSYWNGPDYNYNVGPTHPRGENGPLYGENGYGAFAQTRRVYHAPRRQHIGD
jgi:hypothetical protein